MKFIISVLLLLSFGAQAAPLDALSKVVGHFDVIWNDGNITTGTSRITLTKTKNTNIKMIEQEILSQLVKKLQDRSEGAGQVSKMKVTSAAFKSQDANDIASGYAMGNAFSPKNTAGLNFGVATVYAVLRNLSADKNKDIITTTASAVYKENGEHRKVQLTALIQSSTGEQVQFFFVEGTM